MRLAGLILAMMLAASSAAKVVYHRYRSSGRTTGTNG